MNRVNELLDKLTAIKNGDVGVTLDDAFALIDGAKQDAMDAGRTLEIMGMAVAQYERGEVA